MFVIEWNVVSQGELCHQFVLSWDAIKRQCAENIALEKQLQLMYEMSIDHGQQQARFSTSFYENGGGCGCYFRDWSQLSQIPLDLGRYFLKNPTTQRFYIIQLLNF